MENLFLLVESYTNGYSIALLDCIFLTSILCGIFVIVSKNPIVSVLFLIGLFLSIASYLIALAVGALESRVIGPRSKVWSEAEMVENLSIDYFPSEEPDAQEVIALK